MNAFNFIVGLWLFYLSWGLLMYWIPLWAVLTFRRRETPFFSESSKVPFIYIVSTCRDAASCIPGLIERLKKQNYPSDKFQILLVADNCSDNSAAIARSLGVEVFERTNLQKMGKGYALNEFFERHLQYQSFDGLILFDIDARVRPDFLTRVAAYFQNGAMALQGSTVSKNPNDTMLTKVGDSIQAIIRFHQKGRSLLGLHPMMIGSHGSALTRSSLVKLDWCIVTNVSGDDIELGLRCFLRDIPVTYAENLAVTNDLPAHADVVRKQRRRWTRSILRLTAKYVGPLLVKILQGNLKAIDVLFNSLLNPSFSNLFILLTLTVALLVPLALWNSAITGFAGLAVLLWMCDILYFAIALSSEGTPLRWRDIPRFAAYLCIRGFAFLEGLLSVGSKNWWLTPHESEIPKIEATGSQLGDSRLKSLKKSP